MAATLAAQHPEQVRSVALIEPAFDNYLPAPRAEAALYAREEIFGPVGSIISYDDEEQAIAIANESDYGLSGGVFTEDTERAYAVARRIRTGNFTQNGRVIDFTIPYGGFKMSGLGREGGIEGLHGFTEVKAVFLPRLPAHLEAQ